MSGHRYILQPYRGPASRIKCPACGKPREFARYLDTETSELLPDHVGRCNRELNCGFHFTPKQYFEQEGNAQIGYTSSSETRKKTEGTPPISYLPLDLIEKALTSHNRNNFSIYLKSLFGEAVSKDLISQYFIGTSKHWKGATIFWQIDIDGNIRQCKIMLYNSETGRRVKNDAQALKWNDHANQYEPDVYNGDKIFFAGKRLLNDYNANLQQCYFGEHLLTEHPTKKIGLVESEKTALIASVYFPQLIWLATGGKNGCKWTTRETSKVLTGREVFLFPDLGQYEAWTAKAKEVRRQVTCNLTVSDLLETLANDQQREKGWDLADFLVNKDDVYGWALSEHGYPVFWDYQSSIGQDRIAENNL